MSVFDQSSPPLTKQKSIDSKLGLMMGWGRGGSTIDQILALI